MCLCVRVLERNGNRRGERFETHPQSHRPLSQSLVNEEFVTWGVCKVPSIHGCRGRKSEIEGNFQLVQVPLYHTHTLCDPRCLTRCIPWRRERRGRDEKNRKLIKKTCPFDLSLALLFSLPPGCCCAFRVDASRVDGRSAVRSLVIWTFEVVSKSIHCTLYNPLPFLFNSLLNFNNIFTFIRWISSC